MYSDVFSTIFLGVIAGVLTAGFINVLLQVFTKIVVPWIQSNLVSVDFVGHWQGERKDGGNIYRFDLQLNQIGTKVKGTFTATDTISKEIENGSEETGKDKNKPVEQETRSKTYNLEGTIRGVHTVLTYTPVSSKLLGGGTFVFELHSDGGEMKGAMSYIKTTSGEIQAKDDITLKRVDR